MVEIIQLVPGDVLLFLGCEHPEDYTALIRSAFTKNAAFGYMALPAGVEVKILRRERESRK